MLIVHEISLFPEMGREIGEVIQDLVKVLYLLLGVGEFWLLCEAVVAIGSQCSGGKCEDGEYRFDIHCYKST